MSSGTSSCVAKTSEGELEARITFELEGGLAAEEIEARVAKAKRAGDVGARVVAFYLWDMAERGVQQELGFSSVEDFADQRLGMRPSTTREYLATGRALGDLPELDRAFCEERLFWSQARLLARIATPETERAWVAWAAPRTARAIEAQVGAREKGDLPSDPAKRRIHTTKFGVSARLNTVEWAIWNEARSKLEVATGRPVSDKTLLLELSKQFLRRSAEEMGLPPVNDSHFKVVIQHDPEERSTTLRSEDGPVRLDPAAAREVLEEAGHPELAGSVPEPEGSVAEDDADENEGPVVPPELRDGPTPPALRNGVLARDGFRCLCCGKKRNVAVHHKHWRSYGGRTARDKLLSTCEDCHSLIHDRLLVVRGSVPGGLRFTDRNGRKLGERSAATGLILRRLQRERRNRGRSDVARATGPEPPRPLRFQDLPSQVDAGWWRRHAGLLEWNDRQGELVFQPGVPLDRVPEQEEREAPGPASRAGNVARATRPPALGDVVGQERAVRNLDVAVRAARRLGEPLGHVLLAGAAGLGKTSLARAVAADAGGGFHGCNAPLLKEPGALLRQLLALGDGDILFLDEVHRLPDRVAEVLYEAMEDGQLSLPIRSGVHQRMLHVRLDPFTLIGATTEEELLPAPMRARFRIREQLEFYEASELAELIRRAAGRAGLGITDDAALALAKVSRDTPREALALFEQVRNDSVLASESRIDRVRVAGTLERLGIDERGLRPSERAYLEVLRRAGRPLGLRTLAARLGVSRSALQRVHEPFLLRKGLVRMTQHGRVAA